MWLECFRVNGRVEYFLVLTIDGSRSGLKTDGSGLWIENSGLKTDSSGLRLVGGFIVVVGIPVLTDSNRLACCEPTCRHSSCKIVWKSL